MAKKEKYLWITKDDVPKDRIDIWIGAEPPAKNEEGIWDIDENDKILWIQTICKDFNDVISQIRPPGVHLRKGKCIKLRIPKFKEAK